jgi:hypothetical protein
VRHTCNLSTQEAEAGEWWARAYITRPCLEKQIEFIKFLVFFFFFVVLGFELRAYPLSHSTSPVFVLGFFEIGS